MRQKGGFFACFSIMAIIYAMANRLWLKFSRETHFRMQPFSETIPDSSENQYLPVFLE